MASQQTKYKPEFYLYNYLEPRGAQAKVVLGGSAAPSLSLQELIDLSTDSDKTREVLTKGLFADQLVFTSERGPLALRETIASTFAPTSNITADHVLVANGASGANHVVERSLLSLGDHIIVQYPIYGPCIEEPLNIGCEISYLRADASNGWRVNVDDLRALIKPGKTKMLFFNSPNNPTGCYIDAETQRAIIKIAKEHDLTVFCDEIFWPLFHEPGAQENIPPSFIDHPDLDYDKVVVMSALAKCYGLPGVRIAWIVTRSTSLYGEFVTYRQFSVNALSYIDEIIATEALSSRCRPAILQRYHRFAQQNLASIDAFVKKYEYRVDWVRPTSAATAFVRFRDRKSGEPRDDVEFCDRLFREKGILLSPATPCFAFEKVEGGNADVFKGRVRLQITGHPEVLQAGLKGVGEFLDEEEMVGT